MTTNIHQSKNYVWSTNDILGKGSTCSVYKGINKNNGEFVAIKVVDGALGEREFEMLRKIKHENIVKLLAIEQEWLKGYGQMKPKQILVTELCTGGCLNNILEDPENIYGLEDSEFLLFLSHLYAGMKYLRDNDIVHRDLKPGNIMKSILDDGTSVYKLIDFGAARDLPDEKEFVSFYGTEEYLAPDMYERALLGAPGSRAFRATVDLWSTGVTLYHVVTGDLPFRPYGGRRNRRTMHYITTQKKAGVISGIQQTANGAIIWSSQLPNNCLLSPSLKKIITPLIAGLLESDEMKIWTFKEFFDTVDRIVTRKIVHVFAINNQNLIKIYLNPIDTIETLQEDVSTQTNIAPENQILIYKGDVLNEGLPVTTEKCPLFVFSKEFIEMKVHDLPEMSPIIPFTQKVELGEDFKQAKKACCNAYQAKRLIEKYSLICQLIHNTVENVTKCITMQLQNLMREAEYLMSKSEILKKAVGIFEASQNLSNYKAKTNNNYEELSNISKYFNAIYNLHKKYNCEHVSEKEWESAISCLKNPFGSRLTVRASTHADRIKDSMYHLRTGRDYPLPQNHQYQIERNKIAKSWTNLLHLLQAEVYPQYTSLIEIFASWFKQVQKDYIELETLNETINEFKINLKEFEDKFDADVDEFNEFLKTNLNNNEPTERIKYVKTTALTSHLKNKLKAYNYKTGPNLIAENAELRNKLKECTTDLDGNKFGL